MLLSSRPHLLNSGCSIAPMIWSRPPEIGWRHQRVTLPEADEFATKQLAETTLASRGSLTATMNIDGKQ